MTHRLPSHHLLALIALLTLSSVPVARATRAKPVSSAQLPANTRRVQTRPRTSGQVKGIAKLDPRRAIAAGRVLLHRGGTTAEKTPSSAATAKATKKTATRPLRRTGGKRVGSWRARLSGMYRLHMRHIWAGGKSRAGHDRYNELKRQHGIRGMNAVTATWLVATVAVGAIAGIVNPVAAGVYLYASLLLNTGQFLIRGDARREFVAELDADGKLDERDRELFRAGGWLKD